MVTRANWCIVDTKFRNWLKTPITWKPVTCCFMESCLHSLSTLSLSKPSLTKWFWIKEWLSFTKVSNLKRIPWQLWLELSERFQPFCARIMTSTSKQTDMNLQSNSSLKCLHLLLMLTGLQWDFQLSSQKNITDTWKTSFTWCFPTQCLKSLKLQMKLWGLWR